jgi:predicted dehydrogenase
MAKPELAGNSGRLAFALVGFGSAGERALGVIRGLRPGAEFLVVSRKGGAGEGFRSTSSLDDVVAFVPDAVIVAGPATTRVDVLRQIGLLEVPVFIEKPLAHKLDDAVVVASLLGSALERSQVGYNLRFSESLIAFRDFVRGGQFGRVLRFNAETGQYLPDWRPGKDYRETVSARADLGGGVLLELSHELDYLRWIFGEWEWVSAWTGRTSSLEIDVEDTALVTIGIEGDQASTQVVGQLSLDFVRRDKTRSVTAVCESGTLRWDGIAGTVEIYEASESRWETVVTDSGSQSTYRAQWDSFLSVVEKGSAPLVALSDGVAVLRAVEAIRHSHEQSGARVFLKTVGVGS